MNEDMHRNMNDDMNQNLNKNMNWDMNQNMNENMNWDMNQGMNANYNSANQQPKKKSKAPMIIIIILVVLLLICCGGGIAVLLIARNVTHQIAGAVEEMQQELGNLGQVGSDLDGFGFTFNPDFGTDTDSDSDSDTSETEQEITVEDYEYQITDMGERLEDQSYYDLADQLLEARYANIKTTVVFENSTETTAADEEGSETQPETTDRFIVTDCYDTSEDTFTAIAYSPQYMNTRFMCTIAKDGSSMTEHFMDRITAAAMEKSVSVLLDQMDIGGTIMIDFNVPVTSDEEIENQDELSMNGVQQMHIILEDKPNGFVMQIVYAALASMFTSTDAEISLQVYTNVDAETIAWVEAYKEGSYEAFNQDYLDKMAAYEPDTITLKDGEVNQ